MRIELSDAISMKLAKKQYPWAVKIVKAKGGFLCFENYADFLIWNNTKKEG